MIQANGRMNPGERLFITSQARTQAMSELLDAIGGPMNQAYEQMVRDNEKLAKNPDNGIIESWALASEARYREMKTIYDKAFK